MNGFLLSWLANGSNKIRPESVQCNLNCCHQCILPNKYSM